jgi:hypothetical protein
MADYDSHNQRAIDRLNQRGGRMLSLVDLVDAETLPLDMAALLAWMAAHGGSALTAAGPGGVGKTTLLGGFLAFLPMQTEIVTVDSAAVLRRQGPPGRECLLIHEINNAPYFGYIWGPEIALFMRMIGKGRCVAATLHASSYRELRKKLTGAPLGVASKNLDRVDLVAVMEIRGGARRVTEIWLGEAREGHRQIMGFDQSQDAFWTETDDSLHRSLSQRFGVKLPAVAESLVSYRELISDALDRGIRRMELLRNLARRKGIG